MTITLRDPEGMSRVDILRQVSIATGTKLVFIAGQVAWDASGIMVGKGDLAAQLEHCYLKIGMALADVGGSFDDVAKLTIYVVDWTPDKYSTVLDGIARASAKLGVTPVPPLSLLGISAGFTPDVMVEVEATAVID